MRCNERETREVVELNEGTVALWFRGSVKCFLPKEPTSFPWKDGSWWNNNKAIIILNRPAHLILSLIPSCQPLLFQTLIKLNSSSKRGLPQLLSPAFSQRRMMLLLLLLTPFQRFWQTAKSKPSSQRNQGHFKKVFLSTIFYSYVLLVIFNLYHVMFRTYC